jgi:hypothetical protein
MDVTDIVNIVRRNNNCYDGALGRDYIDCSEHVVNSQGNCRYGRTFLRLEPLSPQLPLERNNYVIRLPTSFTDIFRADSIK